VELQLKTYVTSLVRTVVPILVGNVLGWLTTLGLPLPEEVSTSLTGLLTLLIGAVFSIAYYALVRWLEQEHPSIGILLGIAKAPVAYSAQPDEAKAMIEQDAVTAAQARTIARRVKAAHRADTSAITVVAVRDGEG